MSEADVLNRCHVTSGAPPPLSLTWIQQTSFFTSWSTQISQIKRQRVLLQLLLLWFEADASSLEFQITAASPASGVLLRRTVETSERLDTNFSQQPISRGCVWACCPPLTVCSSVVYDSQAGAVRPAVHSSANCKRSRSISFPFFCTLLSPHLLLQKDGKKLSGI